MCETDVMPFCRVEELHQLPVQPVLPALRPEPGDVRSWRPDPSPALPTTGDTGQSGHPGAVEPALPRSDPGVRTAQHC